MRGQIFKVLKLPGEGEGPGTGLTEWEGKKGDQRCRQDYVRRKGGQDTGATSNSSEKNSKEGYSSWTRQLKKRKR